MKLILALFVALGLSGCATGNYPSQDYSWEHHEDHGWDHPDHHGDWRHPNHRRLKHQAKP
jgi:hypothetical protein